MASPVYVWHGSAQDDGDATWNSSTIAYLTLQLALAAVDAVGIIYVASEHSQTQAIDLTLGSTNGTAANPIRIISVDKDNGDAYLAMRNDGAPGKIEVTGVSSITLSQFDIFIGLTFISDAEDVKISLADESLIFIDCRFEADRNFRFIGGLGTTGSIICEDCVIVLDGVNNQIKVEGVTLRITGGTITNTGTVPDELFSLSVTTRQVNLLVEDVDISGIDGGDYLLDGGHSTGDDILFKRCKIPSGIAGFVVARPTVPNGRYRFHSVSDGDIIYQLKEVYYEGDIDTDVATYRDNAATYDGINEYSVKMVSTANSKEWIRPLRFKLAEIWCAANPTLKVELNIDNVVLQNDEFWIEIEYPDDNTGALGNIDQTSRPATIETAPANLTTSVVAWTEGFGTEKPQKITEVIAGGQAGMHTIWACLAKPSTIVYVCPKIDVS